MILEIIILILAFPLGFLIAWLARDELIEGREYFKILVIMSAIGIIGTWIYGQKAGAWSFGFIFIVGLISLTKSADVKASKKSLYKTNPNDK